MDVVVVVVLNVSTGIATTTLRIESKKAVGERLSTDRQTDRQHIAGNRLPARRPNLITIFQVQMLPQGTENSR